MVSPTKLADMSHKITQWSWPQTIKGSIFRQLVCQLNAVHTIKKNPMIDDLYHPYKVVNLGDPYEFTPHGIVPQLIHVTYPQIDRQRNNEIHQFWLDRFIIRRNPKKQQVLKPSNIKLKLLFAPGKKCITMSSIISSLSHQWGRYVHWNVIEINERFVYVKEWFPIIIWNDSQCQKMVWPRLFFHQIPGNISRILHSSSPFKPS